MTAVKTRNLNLDLIRCAALLMVPIMHSLDHTGLYGQLLYSWPDRLMIAVKTLFTCCIPLYVLLSGYLNNKKQLSMRYYLGLIRIVVTYLICGGACLIFEQLSGIAHRSPREMLSAMLNYSCCDYAWYIMMYLGLFLLIPFLNMAYHGCASKRQKQILVLSFIALSVLPSLFNTYFQLYSIWWARLYPICYYFTGAYLSEYMPELKPGRASLVLFGFLAAYSVFFYFHYDALGAALIGVYQDTWEVYILSVLLFVILFRVRLKSSSGHLAWCLKKISDLTLPAYLLTWIPDSLIYPLLMAAVPAGAPRYKWLFLTVPVSLISALLGAQLVDWIYRPVAAFSSALSKKPFFTYKDPLSSRSDP